MNHRRSLIAFLLALFLAPGFALGADERLKTDRRGNPVGGGLSNDAGLTIIAFRIDPTTKRLLVDAIFGVGATLTADQGASGVSTDPWFMNIRDAAGLELGLAASPFAVRLFDGAGAALGTQTNAWIIGGEDGFSVKTTLRTDPDGRLAIIFGVTIGDGTTQVGGLRTDVGTNTILQVANSVFNGASFDHQRGNALDGTLVDLGLNNDVTVIRAQTASEPVVVSVGTTATLIIAASSTRHRATIQNMGTAVVFLGKGLVTTSTGLGIAGSSVANDAKGASAEANHGDAIFGIVASGTVNVRVQTESD